MSSPRNVAIAQAQALIAAQPIYLDTETTGLEAYDQIVEVCVLDHDGRVLVDTLVKPTGKIPPNVVAVHGITNALVQNAPTWAEVWPTVEQAIGARRIAIYNAAFDVRLMQQSHRTHGLSWCMADSRFDCIMQLYAQFYGQWNARYRSYRWHSLEAAGQQCRIALPNAHRAQADALLAREVLLYMASR